MKVDVQKIFQGALKWLEAETVIEPCKNGWEITLPLLCADNDYIKIYLIKDDEGLYFSDDGYIFKILYRYELELSKREENSLLRDLGIAGLKIQEKEFKLTCTENSCAQQLFIFAQALIKAETLLETMGKMNMYVKCEGNHE